MNADSINEDRYAKVGTLGPCTVPVLRLMDLYVCQRATWYCVTIAPWRFFTSHGMHSARPDMIAVSHLAGPRWAILTQQFLWLCGMAAHPHIAILST